MEHESRGGLKMLPVELMIDILLRLAFRDVVRFKLVSKSLCDLISSLEFADVHLKSSLESGTNSPLLVFKDIGSCYSIEIETLEKSDLTNKFKFNHNLAHGIHIVGSCNGLLCIQKGWSDAILYNPSTRDCYELPASPVCVPLSVPQGVGQIYHDLNYGFGYDNACNDYKVIKIITFSSDISSVAFSFGAMIYSLKMNSWRNVEPPPSYICKLYSDRGVLCNNALHWIYSARDGSDMDLGIIGFDLHSETYHQVLLPNHSLKFKNISLGILGGRLCATSLRLPYISSWVMKEYGMKDSWTVLFAIRSTALPCSSRCLTHVMPLAYSKSEDELLVELNNTHFLWWDLRNKKVKCPMPCNQSGAIICMQSLVSPKKWES